MTTRHERARARADRLIKRWGMNAILRRGVVDRDVRVVEDDFSIRERDGSLVLVGDTRYLVSPLFNGLPIVPPDMEQDVLVIDDPVDDSLSTELLIASPPGRLAPGGVVIYYTLHVRSR